MSVAVLKNGFDQVNHKSMIGFEIEVLENIGYFALGVYNIKNLLEKMPQTIGKLWPNRHNYYLVDKYGSNLFYNIRFIVKGWESDSKRTSINETWKRISDSNRMQQILTFNQL